MADIVKAVGNCSYNQLVEKIISCKQSDSSELAGEGGYSLFYLSSPPFPFAHSSRLLLTEGKCSSVAFPFMTVVMHLDVLMSRIHFSMS